MALRLTSALAAGLALILPALAAGAAQPWDGAPFSADPAALIAAAQALQPPKGAGIDLLLEEGRYAYDERGALTLRHRVVFRVLTADAARAWSRLERSWAPWSQARPEIRARVITARGEVRELDPATLSEQGVRDRGEMYSDRRVLAGPLPALQAGAVVEELVTIRDTAPTFDAGVSSRFFLAQPTPVRLVRFELTAPAALPLRWVVRGTDARPAVALKDGVRRVTLERRDVPAAPAVDPGAPHELPAAPHVLFGWGRSWEDVARRYGELWERQLAGADLAAAARAALGEGRPDRAEAVRRVVAWVHQNVRYTGLELGEAALVPAPPGETLKRRYGDCKDLSLLVVGLLRAAGLDARLALLRLDWQELDPEVPGISQFDHAVVRVEGAPPIWIDATDPFTPPGGLPPPAEGRLALVTGPRSRELVRTPERGAEANTGRTVRELELAELGPGRILETRELTGALAAAERAFRDRLTPERGNEMTERYAQEVLRGRELGESSIDGREDLSGPLRVKIEARGSSAVHTADDLAEVPVTPDLIFEALPEHLAGFHAGEEGAGAVRPPRRADAILPVPYRWEAIYRVRPPDGFKARPLPANGSEAFGPARYTQTYALGADGVVTATFRFDTGGRRLAAADAERLSRRVREIVRGSSPLVSFERTGAALLAAGRVPEALAEMRRLVSLHPAHGLHRAHLALALLQLGFEEEAAAEARRAVSAEPELAYAHRVLGWALEHDAVGRFHGPGFDRAGALAAYREARALDPDHAGGRAALAELLARDAAGAPAKELPEAIAEFEALRADLGEQQFERGHLRALLAAGRLADAEALARGLPAGPERDATLLAAVAGQRGAPAAEQDARGMGEGRREALREAARLLVARRRYAEAAALAGAAALGAQNAAEIRQQADTFEGLRPWESLAEQGSEGERLVKRLFVSALRPGGKVPAPAALLSRRRLSPALQKMAEEGLTVPALGARRALHDQGIPADVLLDLVLSRAEILQDGDPRTGLRLRVQFPFAPSDGSSALFAIREGKALQLVTSDAAWPVLADEARRAAEAGDAATARRWLDWTREELPGRPGEPASPAGVLEALWRPGAAGAAAEARRAAVALLAWVDADGKLAPLLSEARARAAAPAERRALGFALAQAHRAAHHPEDQLRVARELMADDPASREAFALAALALQDLKRPAELDPLAAPVLARLPDDPEILALVGNVRLALGDLDGAARTWRRIIDGGKAGTMVFNNAAWLELFRQGAGKDALDWARRAVEGGRGREHPSLNTLAAVYASAGQPAEARDVFLRSLDAAGDETLGPSDWFVFARIAEAWGLGDVARACYGRVQPEPEDPTAAYHLARARLAALGPAPVAPAPAAAPAPAGGGAPPAGGTRLKVKPAGPASPPAAPGKKPGAKPAPPPPPPPPPPAPAAGPTVPA
jgi:transglutaminase-like putative cysteine protease